MAFAPDTTFSPSLTCSASIAGGYASHVPRRKRCKKPIRVGSVKRISRFIRVGFGASETSAARVQTLLEHPTAVQTLSRITRNARDAGWPVRPATRRTEARREHGGPAPRRDLEAVTGAENRSSRFRVKARSYPYLWQSSCTTAWITVSGRPSAKGSSSMPSPAGAGSATPALWRKARSGARRVATFMFSGALPERSRT